MSAATSVNQATFSGEVKAKEQCVKETCPTSMLKYIYEPQLHMDGWKVQDLISFLQDGKFNTELMKGHLKDLTEETRWGTFHPIARVAEGDRARFGRLFESTTVTGNKNNPSGKDTIFLHHIVLAMNHIFKSEGVALELEVEGKDYKNGRVELKGAGEYAALYPKLPNFVNFLNVKAGSI